MRYAVLASSSRANCTFVECGESRILIDCGLSGKETARRLSALGVDPGSITALLVTHEHSDHISGVGVYARRYQVPVYATCGTAAALDRIPELHQLSSDREFSLGGVRIRPFPIVHDAVEPVGYRIEHGGMRFCQLTDLGKITHLVRDVVLGCDGVVLESNYDRSLLYDCAYPWQVKQRISSSTGHLSNDEASAFLEELIASGTRQVVLGHLSENSNTPAAALGAARRCPSVSDLEVLICGCRERSTPLLSLLHGAAAECVPKQRAEEPLAVEAALG